MGAQDHKPKDAHVKCAVLTVSDTRNEETDKSGGLIISLLEESGHEVVERKIVKDEKEAIHSAIKAWTQRNDLEAILINGGTGIAKRDVTVEVVEGMLDKTLPGFGEVFRMLSYTEDIGSAAILSRATAGTVAEKVIFSMPGSTGAVRLAMTKLILPELGHVMFEINK